MRRRSGTTIFVTDHVAPKTSNRLNILLPTTFPIAISEFLLSEAITEVASSGKLVPNAIMVSPITDSDIPYQRAIFFADHTRKFAPIESHTSPPIIYRVDFITLICFVVSWFSVESSGPIFESPNV